MIRKWRRLIGLVALAIALAFFLPYLYANAGHLREVEWSLRALASFGLAMLLYAAVMAIGPLNWFVLMRVAGESLGFLDSVVIFFLAQFGKYLPGNLAQHVGRVVLAKEYGYAIPPVLFTMVIEMALVIGGAVLFSVLTLGLIAEPLGGFERLGGGRVLAGLAAAAAVVAIAALAWWKRKHGVAVRLLHPRSIVYAGVLCLNATAFFLLGVATMFLANGIFGVQSREVFLFGAATTLSWLAGFVAPGAPAGLGVREAMMVALLDPAIGARGALGTTLAFRAVSVITDGLTFAFAGLLRAAGARPRH